MRDGDSFAWSWRSTVHIAPEVESEIHRVILLRGTTSPEVLLVFDGSHQSLPEVRLPRSQRVAEHLTKAIRNAYGIEGVALFSLPKPFEPSNPTQIRYEVVESFSRENSLPASRWVAVDSLEFRSFLDPEDSKSLERGLVEIEAYVSGSRIGPFGKLGWFPELKDWVDSKIVRHGLQLSGPYQQFNTGPRFSLIRFETNGAAVWFKAVGEPNLREYPITVALSEYFPAFLPEVIATRPEWNGWLAIEVKGSHPAPTSGMDAWIAVATTLAELQILSLGRSCRLLELGCQDMRIASLLRLIDPFLHVSRDLMAEQTTRSPAPLSARELSTLGTQLFDLFTAIADSGVPDCLGHLDLNPGNIMLAGHLCKFLDWAEACFGHPFSTFQYLLEQLRRFPRQCNSWSTKLLSAYTEPWRQILKPNVLADSVAAAPLIAVFAHAISGQIWRDATFRFQPEKRAYLRSLTRRIKREADLLSHSIPHSKRSLHSHGPRYCS